MSSSVVRSVLVGFMAAWLGGCGFDAVVGGACKSGLTESDGRCVRESAGPSTIAPETESAPTTLNGAPGTTTPPSYAPSSSSTHPSSAASPSDPSASPNESPAEEPAKCTTRDDDALNCGACGRICPSNICVAGVCQGATPGDVVLIGHDMTNAWAGSVQGQILANAVSIPTANPIRVLSFEPDGDQATTRAMLHDLVHRSVELTLTDSAASMDRPDLYSHYDVVLAFGTGPAARQSGKRVGPALTRFTKAGGVFIAVDSGKSDMPALLQATGLLAVDGHKTLPLDTRFDVSTASDTVGARLLTPFAAFGSSVAFAGVAEEDEDLHWVVRTSDGAPTVIHRIVR